MEPSNMAKFCAIWNVFNNALSNGVLDRGLLGDLLVGLGCQDVKVYRGGESYRTACPIHGGRRPNLHIKTGGDTLPIRWACRSRHCEARWKPSLLGLVRGVLSAQKGQDVHPQVAADFLKKFLGGLPRGGPRRRPKPQPKHLALTREQARSRLVVPSPYFVVRGFSPAVLVRLDVGHSKKQGKTIVPLHDDGGETVIGYLARSELPPCGRCRKDHTPGRPCGYGQPGWKTMEGFAKGAYLYNYATALHSPLDSVLVVEGPADVWRAEEAGFLAVALLGTDATAQQAKKLAALRKLVILALDNDKAGREAMVRVYGDLLGKVRGPCCLYVPSPYKDLGEMPHDVAAGWLSENILAPMRPPAGGDNEPGRCQEDPLPGSLT